MSDRQPWYRGYHPDGSGTTPAASSASVETLELLPDRRTPEIPRLKPFGLPCRKSVIDWLDVCALLLSILCLSAGIVIITPKLPFAAKLGVDRQIIAIGFLLGLINQCLLRVLPNCFILVESRFGSSRLQNYEGLLRWSPFADRLGTAWRSSILFLTLLPLVTSVLYKNFRGGLAVQRLNNLNQTYLPTGPPGLQGHIGWNQVMANATVPFMANTTEEIAFPSDLNVRPRVYGFNTILLSNESAAAVDGPDPVRVRALQDTLEAESFMYLTANVRGTVARHNSTIGDRQYWNVNYNFTGVPTWNLFNDYWFAAIQAGTAADNSVKARNGSWTLTGFFHRSMANGHNPNDAGRIFLDVARRFDVKRHACSARWRISRSSIELVEGRCGDQLPLIDQYYSNCEISLLDILGRSIVDSLAPFATARNQSQWLVPTHTVIIASAYQAIIAANRGHIPIQVAGPVYNLRQASGKYTQATISYETYQLDELIEIQIPSLKDSWGLYFILALQPTLTLLAFFTAAVMFQVPIARTFGLMSILAGVNHEDLNVLAGAAFSGKLTQPVRLQVNVVASQDEDGSARPSIEYRLCSQRPRSKVRRRQKYE